jgi:hypothetical protein
MGNAQFIRLQGYGTEPRRQGKQYETAEGVLDEIVRATGAHPHIDSVRPPIFHLGNHAVVERLKRYVPELARGARDRIRRAIRRDGVFLIAGVVSYPLPREDFGGFVSDRDVCSYWIAETVKWLIAVHGDSLEVVVEHTDEPFVHLHFACVPQLDDEDRLDFSLAHPGRAARNAEIDATPHLAADADPAERRKLHKQADLAYQQAMRRYQSDYFEQVSKFFGMVRTNGTRPRLSRKQVLFTKTADGIRREAKAAAALDFLAAERPEQVAALLHALDPSAFNIVAIDEIATRQSEIEQLAHDNLRLVDENRRLLHVLREHGIEPYDSPSDGDPPQLEDDVDPPPLDRVYTPIAKSDEEEFAPIPFVAPPTHEDDVRSLLDWNGYRRRQRDRLDQLLQNPARSPTARPEQAGADGPASASNPAAVPAQRRNGCDDDDFGPERSRP